jgi:hypothetical protein
LERYTLGFYCGKKEMETFTGNLINGVAAGVSGESISVLLSAAAVISQSALIEHALGYK